MNGNILYFSKYIINFFLTTALHDVCLNIVYLLCQVRSIVYDNHASNVSAYRKLLAAHGEGPRSIHIHIYKYTYFMILFI